MSNFQQILRANAAFDGPLLGTRFDALMVSANGPLGSETEFELADEGSNAHQEHQADSLQQLDYDVSLQRQMFNLKLRQATA